MSDLILSPSEAKADPFPKKKSFPCFNGPCQGSTVDAPADTTPGNAVALPWQTIKREPRFAVYVVVEFQGQEGLMYLKSYDKPFKAQQRVREISAVCAVGVSDE